MILFTKLLYYFLRKKLKNTRKSTEVFGFELRTPRSRAKWLSTIFFSFNCWFIVDSTQYRRYLDLPFKMVGTFNIPPSTRRELAPKTHTGATQDRTRARQHRRPACRHWQYNYDIDQATDDPRSRAKWLSTRLHV